MQRDHTELIQTFIDFTGANEENAIQTLQAFKWDLQEAVNYFLEPNGNSLPQPTPVENEGHSLPPLNSEMGVDDVSYPPARANSPLGFDTGSNHFPVHPSNIHQALSNPNLYSSSPFPNIQGRSNNAFSEQTWPSPSQSTVREVNTTQWGRLNQVNENDDFENDIPDRRVGNTVNDDSFSKQIDFDDVNDSNLKSSHGMSSDRRESNFESRFGSNKASEPVRFASDQTFEPNRDSGINENDFLEEEMLRAAIEASKQEAELIRIANMEGDGEPSFKGELNANRISNSNLNSNYFVNETENVFNDNSFHSNSLSFRNTSSKIFTDQGGGEGEGGSDIDKGKEENENEKQKEKERRNTEDDFVSKANENISRWDRLIDENDTAFNETNKKKKKKTNEMQSSDEEEEEEEEEEGVKPHPPLLRRNRRHGLGNRTTFDDEMDDSDNNNDNNINKNNNVFPTALENNYVFDSNAHNHNHNQNQNRIPLLNSPNNEFDHFSSQQIEGMSSEDREMAAMYESAFFGIPYVNRSSSFTHLHPRPPFAEGDGHGLPSPFPPLSRNPPSFGEDEHPLPLPLPFPHPLEDDILPTRTPSFPELAEQRLIREMQDDEYMASLAADQEKEMEARREEERLKKEKQEKESLEKKEREKEEKEKEEMERALDLKKNQMVEEPPVDHENALTLLIKMPDGSRIGRRFLRSHTLQNLFDYIDVTCVLKPGSYRLIGQFPRRVLTQDRLSDLGTLGFNNKQEVLYLEYV